MKRTFLTFVCAAFALFVFGNSGASWSVDVRAQKQDAARSEAAADAAQKFDEFGRIGHCDFTARLDNFAVALQNDPQLHGYLLSYSGRIHVEAVAGRWLDYMKNYLINSRGVDPERFDVINGGVQAGEEVRNELWLAPAGAPAPVPSPLPAEEAARPFYGKLHEYETMDMYYGSGDGEGMPSITLPNFAGRLKQQPDARGYLVIYESPDSNPGAWRRLAKREAASLAGFGLDANRYRVINAGEGKELKVELWVLERDAPPPVAETKSKAKTRREAFNLGSFNEYDLSEADGAKWARDGLADMLLDDPRARGCLVIHPATPDEETRGEAAEPSGADEAPRVDLRQLAERWQTELAKEFGIAQERVVILVGSPNAWDGAALETWVVPQDAALPDPFAEDVEPEIEESEEAAPPAQAVGGKEQKPPTLISEFRRFFF